jgi:hypothetical protein
MALTPRKLLSSLVASRNPGDSFRRSRGSAKWLRRPSCNRSRGPLACRHVSPAPISPQETSWIAPQWKAARLEARDTAGTPSAIEGKTAPPPNAQPGLADFTAKFKPGASLLVGEDGIPVVELLARPVEGRIKA